MECSGQEDVMDYNEFMDFVYKRLHELLPERKDAWILEQARLIPESAYQFVSDRRKEDNIHANRNGDRGV